MTTTTIFTALRAREPIYPGHYITFVDKDTSTYQTLKDYGLFNPEKGLFDVHISGRYLFLFKAAAHSHSQTLVQLRVNGQPRAFSVTYEYTNGPVVHDVALSALLDLDTGDKVGVYIDRGNLYDTGESTQFSGMFCLSDNE